jgi:hypothetical protein
MTRRDTYHAIQRLTALALLLLSLSRCLAPSPPPERAGKALATAPSPRPTTLESSPTPAPTNQPGPIVDEESTLSSLKKLDDHPLYIMQYQGAYEHRAPLDLSNSVETPGDGRILADRPAWSCSLFAALGDPASRVYGRNFDWEHSPALLLFTDPPDGYASASMVDIAYLGISPEALGRLDELPLDERRPLLRAPLLPFDGMNEHGLTVGMAAVPPGDVPPDPAKETAGSLEVIREMLDHARTVDEAAAILQSYNVNFDGGPPLHYLIADPSGEAVLVEFYQGELVVIGNTESWHMATNFLVAAAEDAASDDHPEGTCWRYELITERLAEHAGRLGQQAALDLLSSVSQPNTQWSIVYSMSSGEITVAMGRGFDRPLELALTMAMP